MDGAVLLSGELTALTGAPNGIDLGNYWQVTGNGNWEFRGEGKCLSCWFIGTSFHCSAFIYSIELSCSLDEEERAREVKRLIIDIGNSSNSKGHYNGAMIDLPVRLIRNVGTN